MLVSDLAVHALSTNGQGPTAYSSNIALLLYLGDLGPINSIAFRASGNIIISGGEDGYMRVQELDKKYLEFD